MRRIGLRAASGAAIVTAGALLGMAPANAEPANDPCANSGVFFCRLLPIMPELEHDIDMSTSAPSDHHIHTPHTTVP